MHARGHMGHVIAPHAIRVAPHLQQGLNGTGVADCAHRETMICRRPSARTSNAIRRVNKSALYSWAALGVAAPTCYCGLANGHIRSGQETPPQTADHPSGSSFAGMKVLSPHPHRQSSSRYSVPSLFQFVTYDPVTSETLSGQPSSLPRGSSKTCKRIMFESLLVDAALIATSYAVDGIPFKMAGKRYKTPGASSNGVTLIFTHASGARTWTIMLHAPIDFHRLLVLHRRQKHWEPIIRALLLPKGAASDVKLPGIRELWSLDALDHGDSAVANHVI
ncbi:hypothetical protein BDW22DRAFT_1346389 [Trametopsis cervina]|nr:hypothetical protein BDW22DRAFT_1346389 [Trametopsis cervina]